MTDLARGSREMTAGRWELLRALGAVADSPADARTASLALGLAGPDAAEHTEVFVLNCPPYASVYLGEQGSLGGEGTDRVAGFWRVLGLTPPAEPDHLTALLSLYAGLGEAASEARRHTTAGALTRAREALFTEHLWPWLPGYLDAVADLRTPALPAWARLIRQALLAEHSAMPACPLPLALREAPGPLTADATSPDLAAALTAPIRSGIILTRRSLAAGAQAAETGYRIGERRFALRAMLEQDPAQTLRWLAAEALAWSARHTWVAPGDAVQQWWAQRARHTANLARGAA